MTAKNSQGKRTIMIFVIIALFSIIISTSTLTLSSVVITPIGDYSPRTNDNLNCSWLISEIGSGAKANITWYKDGLEINITLNHTSQSSIISSSLTSKGETWNCSVIIGNNSDSSSRQMSSVTIKNSPPSTPFLQYEGTNIGEYYSLIENNTYVFILNTTDPDGDSLDYSAQGKNLSVDDNYCSIAEVGGIGIITCIPTLQPDLTANDKFRFIADDEEDGGVVGTNIFFNVTPVNDIPNISLSNKNITEGDTLSYTFTVHDEENNTGPYYFNMSSNYSEDGLNITAVENNFLIKFQNNRPSAWGDVRNNTVNVTICDPEDDSLCTSDTFILQVISTNHFPNLSLIPNATGAQNELFTLFMNATDLDDNTLTFYINGINCGYDPWKINTTNSSNNATAMINMTLNNSHILCPNITITVNDGQGKTDSQNVYLNLTNEDDAPIIYNMSYSQNNSHGNNISNLIGFTNVLFTYQINGTDVDYGFDPYETLTYTDNSSLCGMNCPELIMSNTGLINQTFTQAGNFSYEINLTDYYLNYSTTIMNIEVLNNSFPFYNHSIINLTVNETEELHYDINATDPDGTLINFTDNVGIINITNEGLINHNYSCEDIGNYTISVTAEDQSGAQNTTTFNLEILNKPQAPILPDFGNLTIWEGYQYHRYVNLETVDYDLDTYCSKTTDTLTYTSEFTQGDTLFNISSTGTIGIDTIFIPTKAQADQTYVIKITVFDTYGLNSSKLWNLTIGNRSDSPVMWNITPHGKPINLTWARKTDYPNNITNTNTTENTIVYFNHNTTDPENDPLVFNWTLNGIAVSDNKNYSKYFGYDDADNYNITLKVSDNFTGLIENTISFTWNLTISNLNRAPLLNGTLPDQNLSNNIILTEYLTENDDDEILFNDPDGDTLTYNFSPTLKFNITQYGLNSVYVVPIEEGVETFRITASDGEYSITSHNITFNITGVPNTTIETITEETGGGSSSSSSSSNMVPYSVIEEVEIEKEVYLDIVNPEPAIIYGNNTLRQVINIINSGNKTLRGITLSASTNSSTADLSFSNNYIPELLEGENIRTDLIIVDYKIYNNYEIVIYANVTEPKYKDKAVIYVNAIEKSRGNQSVTSTKITFAQDLLSSNPECVELNEFLKRARDLMEQEDYEEASKIIDAVIQGCKYLVSQTKIYDERPMAWVLDLGLDKTPYLKPVLAAFIIILIGTVIVTIKLKKSNDKEEQA